MILHQIPYKGKWFIYSDEPDEMFGSEGQVRSGEVTDDDLLSHAAACSYYGIPMYTGKNEEFNQRCENAYQTYVNTLVNNDRLQDEDSITPTDS